MLWHPQQRTGSVINHTQSLAIIEEEEEIIAIIFTVVPSAIQES